MLTGMGATPGGLDPAMLFAPIAHHRRIGLAVSGGPDSLALMALAAAWAPPSAKPQIIVYCVDHRLRPEGRAEAAMVKKEAERLGLAVRSLAWESDKPATGRQHSARLARYRLIGQAMRADGVEVLLTGHHRRDQVETVLMRVAHGSGVTGLAGMRPFATVEGITVFRPLLKVPPRILAGIAAGAGFVPAQDPSNADPAYERTRWRGALPGLAALGLTEQRIAQMAERLGRIDGLAEKMTGDFLGRHGRVDGLGVVGIGGDEWMAAEPEIGIRVLGAAIATASGRRFTMLGKLENLYDGLMADRAGSATLGGARVEWKGSGLIVYREAGRLANARVRVGPGAAIVWDGRFAIAAHDRSVSVEPARGHTRAAYRDLTGAVLAVPVAALRAAPLIRSETGEVLALGEHVLGPGINVRRPALTA